jgi:hypothetical protein
LISFFPLCYDIQHSTTNLEGEEIVDSPGKDGNASMLEQVKRPNPWMTMMMMMMIFNQYLSPYMFCQ